MRAHLVDVERLGDVVGGPQLETLHLLIGRVDHGDEDHRDAVPLRRGLDAAADLVAVHVWHHDVQQHQVGRRGALHRIDRLDAVAGDHDAVVALQGFEQLVDVLGDVVHHQQRGRVRRIVLGGDVEHHRVLAIAPQFELVAHARFQKLRVDRLGDVVGHAHGQAPSLVRCFGQGGDENHRDVRRGRVDLQRGEHGIPIHARHLDVEQDQVRQGISTGLLQGLFPAGGGGDGVLIAQHMHQGMKVLVHVVDDQDAVALVGLFSDGFVHGIPPT